MPVDGVNIKREFAEALNSMHLSIGYTQFAVDELVKSGLTSPTQVIPHGIDTGLFSPVDMTVARKKLRDIPRDWFIVGLVNRNQPRKRIDLAMQYFAEWAKDKPDNVKFYFHGALRDLGWDIMQLAEYHNIGDRLVITSPDMTPANGVPRDFLKFIYSSMNVHITTTLGEGWGLTQMESMACKVANIVPNWSGLGEWAKNGASFIPCTSTQTHTGGLNTIGGVADKALFIAELDKMYHNRGYRESVAQSGYDLVTKPEFQWSNIARRFDSEFTKLLYK